MRGSFYVVTRRCGYYIGMVIAGVGRKLDRAHEKRQPVSPRSILITGASSGIGAELARQYAGQGVFLYLTGRSQERLSAIAVECMGKGAKVETKPMDICDDVAIEKWIKELPRLDLVIANAGVSGGTVEGVNNAAVREIFSVNVGGVLNTVLPAIEKARDQQVVDGYRGHIAVMGSIAGLHPMPTAAAYSASKACVNAYADALRGALKPEKILVTTIGPGYIKTSLTAANNFRMPLLLEVNKAAEIIRTGLWKRYKRIYFPRRMYYLLRFVNILPLWLTDPIFRRLPDKA